MINFIKNFLRNSISIGNDKNSFFIGSSHFALARNNYSKIKNLFEADYKVFSQTGEDGILDFLIYSLQIQKPTFIEIGVGNYRESNTRYIFERYNSKGIIIDKVSNFKKKVSENIKLWKGDLEIIDIMVDSDNINKIISSRKFIKELDIFSLDIDGIDYWIIDKLPKNISKIFVAEYNPIFGASIEVTVPNIKNFDRSKYHYSYLCYGMSLVALIKIMKTKNFVFVGTNLACHNAFFVSNDFLSDIKIELPQENKLNKFMLNNFRDSRSKEGKMNYLSDLERLNEIKNCTVVDLSSEDKKLVKLSELIKQ